jgi:NTE family protein
MKERALVLGGGGLAGVAWMTGLISALSEQDIDLRTADLMVGTSAGSAVAAQLNSGLSTRELFRRQVDPAMQTRELAPSPRVLQSFQKFLLAGVPFTKDRAELTKRIGRWALEATTVSEQERRSVIAQRLPTHSWPESPLLIVAVEVESGATKVFDRSCGTDLVDAVCASCAVPGIWPPVTINGKRYMDGGVRSADNADLADGYSRVLIFSPLGSSHPKMWGGHLKKQVATLKQTGGKILAVEPDKLSRKAFGTNPLSPATRKPAAEAGYRQGQNIAIEIASFWV